MRKEEEKEDEERPDSQAVRQSMQCSEEGSQADRYRCVVDTSYGVWAGPQSTVTSTRSQGTSTHTAMQA